MSHFDNEVNQIETNIRQWFSADVFVKASKIGSYPLFGEEQDLMKGAVLKRQQEFSTGRWLARQGLNHFGLGQMPIGMGRLHNPLWPDATLGSITHDAECCAVVIQEKQQHPELGIGIDLVALQHRADRLQGLDSMISTDKCELDSIARFELNADPLLVLFSIKESVIKALSFFLTDFIDMRSIEIGDGEKLTCKLDDYQVNADLYAATSHDNLVTVAKVYQITK